MKASITTLVFLFAHTVSAGELLTKEECISAIEEARSKFIQAVVRTVDPVSVASIDKAMSAEDTVGVLSASSIAANLTGRTNQLAETLVLNSDLLCKKVGEAKKRLEEE